MISLDSKGHFWRPSKIVTLYGDRVYEQPFTRFNKILTNYCIFVGWPKESIVRFIPDYVIRLIYRPQKDHINGIVLLSYDLIKEINDKS